MARETFVLTGVTSGMGLHIAGRLVEKTTAHLIVGARDPDNVEALRAVVPARRLTVLPLDLTVLSSVRLFVDGVREHLGGRGRLSAIVCNAGIQFTGAKTLTADGVEATFAANHLGHFALVDGLRDCLVDGGVVVTTGSGTHNPEDKIAKMFGFRGAQFAGAAAVADGDLGAPGSVKQQAMDRYATSKLCNILYVRDMARRVDRREVSFVCFDPGLMPGTGLARDRSALEQFGWKRIMPALRFVMAGISTPRKSGHALVDLILLADDAPRTGSYVEFTGRPAPEHANAQRIDWGEDLHDISRKLITTGQSVAA